MANSDKDIKITPNAGSANSPKIEFTGADDATKTLTVADSGALSFNHDLTVDGDLTITGDFSITGDLNTVSATDLDVVDATITIASGASTLALTDAAGIQFGSHASAPTFTWDNTNSRLASNKPISASAFIGALTGSVTGDVSGSSGSTTGNAATATKIASITNSNIVQLAEAQTLTNKTIGISQVTELSNLTAVEGAQLENIDSVTITNTQWGYLGAATGAITNTDTTYSVMNSGNSYAAGLVPAGNATHANKFLRYDGTWVVPENDNTEYTGGTNLTLDSGAFNVDDAFLVNDANDTTTGTITAGGFTTAGSITLGGHAVDDIDVATEFVDSDNHLMTSAAIQDKILGYNYGTSSLALGETSSTAYRGDRGKTAYDHSQATHAPSGAEANQNAWGIITVPAGTTTQTAAVDADSIAFTVAGGMTITGGTDTIAFSSADTNYYATGLGLSSGTLTATVSGASNPTVDLSGLYTAGTNLSRSGTTLNVDTALTGLTDLDLTAGNKTIFDTVGANTLTIGASNTTISIAGDLLVGGTTSTINSTTVTVDDPIFTLGGDTAPASDDNKDRGIEFRYHTGSAAAVGFMGYDDSASKFTMLTGATNTSEVFSGTKGTLVANLEGNVTGALTGNADTVTTNANLTGDITSSGNATSIASGVIVNADVNASAAIAYSKLNLTGAIVNADLASGVDASKLTTGDLPNARIQDDAITTAKIANDQITTATLAPAAVDNTALAASGLSASKITVGTLPDARYDSGISTIADAGATEEFSEQIEKAMDEADIWIVLTATAEHKLSNDHFGQIFTIDTEQVRIIKKASTELSTPTNNAGDNVDYGLKVTRAARGTSAASHTVNTALKAKSNRTIRVTKTDASATTKDSYIPEFGGADSSVASTTGLVPIAATGDTAKFLRGDGTWASASTSGMTSFTLTGDSGTNQSVADGNTVDIAGGTGISTVVGATDTVTVAIDSTVATLAGTQTFSGAKTLSSLASFTMDGNTITGVDDSGEFTNDDAHIMTSAAIEDKITGYGYTTNTGDITGVTAGTGLSGGGSSGGVTLNLSHLGLESLATNEGADRLLMWDDSESAVAWYNPSLLAPFNASYIVASSNGTLSAERVLTAGSGISITDDSGAGTMTIAASGGGATALDGLSDVKFGGTNFTNSMKFGSTTTGTLSGATGNTIIGDGAGDQITSSSHNVLVGRSAGYGITSGGYNIGIGSYAAQNATTHSIHLGYESGKNATGAHNIGIGFEAIRAATGQGNIGIGREAGNDITSGTDNTIIGYKAAKTFTTSGDNIAIGPYAMQLATSGWNIAIGNSALEDVTGNTNMGIGFHAGQQISSGTSNLAIGYQALDGATTESHNIAIGMDALGGAVAGGEYNLAIGNYALDALTSGDKNIAIGYEAGTATTTAGLSTFVGYQAGYRATTQYQNTAFGAYALKGASGTVTGEKNTAIGYNALKVTSTGTFNTSLGNNSLAGVNTGSYNIGVGFGAGDNITTGDNNVMIGGADAASATGDDQLSISSGDGGVTWITGDAGGLVYQKAGIVSAGSNTTLTQAQSGSYVYWTSGTLTLPENAEAGTQFTIFNNTGSSATVAIGSGDQIATNWASNAAVADNDATAYVCVAHLSGTSHWVQVGA